MIAIVSEEVHHQRDHVEREIPAVVKVRTPAEPWKRKLFNGLAQVIVQSTAESGELTLVATAPGLEKATLTSNQTVKLGPEHVTPAKVGNAMHEVNRVLFRDGHPRRGCNIECASWIRGPARQRGIRAFSQPDRIRYDQPFAHHRREADLHLFGRAALFSVPTRTVEGSDAENERRGTELRRHLSGLEPTRA